MAILLGRLTVCALTACWMSAGAESRPADRPADPPPNTLTAAERAAGFRLLFDGRSLAGWKHNGKEGSFTVKDGAIVGDRTGQGQLAYWLSTDREYADFELRLQCRIRPRGNTGIFIRAPHQGRTSTMGMEIQMLDDGAKKGTPGKGDTGAIYRVVAPKKYAARPAGEWNDVCILCEGDRVKVTLNGEEVTDALMSDYSELKSRPRKGYIGLSAHTDPVCFRSIRLREITRSTTAPATRPRG